MNDLTLLCLLLISQWFHSSKGQKEPPSMFVSSSFNAVANCLRLFCHFGMFLEATVMLIAREDMSLHLYIHLLICFGVSCVKKT